MKKKQTSPAFVILMWLAGILMLYPFIMMLVIAFRVPGDAYKGLLASVQPTTRNFAQVIGHPNFHQWYFNTIITVGIAIVLRLIVTIPAAYAFSQMRSKAASILMLILLATMMVPGETTMVPRYLYFRSLHLLDSFWVIVLPEISEVFYLILMVEFFKSIPNDFSEAAQIDGAGNSIIMMKIFVPLSGPSIATVVLFSFINIWNNFIDPYLFISSISHQLITPALKYFQEQGGANIPVQLAGASMAVIPVVILFVATQRFFVAGVSSSGIKG